MSDSRWSNAFAWINNDRLRRDVETNNDIFGQILLFNKATIAIEMFHESFGWSDAQNAKLSEWLNRRAVEMFPSDRRPISIKCPTNPRDKKFNSFEACQNGGILRAQALLRVGIWNKDPELVEMAYVAFHRYMTGIREDGSNITDSARGCAAADYNIWASHFMSDFLFHWDRIAAPLWDIQFNDVASPAEAVEYSLSLHGILKLLISTPRLGHGKNVGIIRLIKPKKLQEDMKKGFGIRARHLRPISCIRANCWRF